ncbi:hypothetical protein B7494_g6379 [Chlorociboria aeruginascens]|nr:hypothetical protein B7494_g6379 [Chlorociboria aeruginascens]
MFVKHERLRRLDRAEKAHGWHSQITCLEKVSMVGVRQESKNPNGGPRPRPTLHHGSGGGWGGGGDYNCWIGERNVKLRHGGREEGEFGLGNNILYVTLSSDKEEEEKKEEKKEEKEEKEEERVKS